MGAPVEIDGMATRKKRGGEDQNAEEGRSLTRNILFHRILVRLHGC